MYTGNVFQAGGDFYQPDDQFIIDGYGRKLYRQIGLAILTDTLQTSIPVIIRAPRNKELATSYPDSNIVLPIGAQVVSASLRLPSAETQPYTRLWGAQLPTGCTIIGTSTDVLKVGFAVNGFAAAKTASIASASSVYALGASNRISRGWATADDGSGILNTVASSAKTVRLYVDNAANDAAGTGIRLSQSGVKAGIVVDVIWTVAGDAARFDDIHNLTETYWVRS
jgi:hypothetical protein